MESAEINLTWITRNIHKLQYSTIFFLHLGKHLLDERHYTGQLKILILSDHYISWLTRNSKFNKSKIDFISIGGAIQSLHKAVISFKNKSKLSKIAVNLEIFYFDKLGQTCQTVRSFFLKVIILDKLVIRAFVKYRQ